MLAALAKLPLMWKIILGVLGLKAADWAGEKLSGRVAGEMRLGEAQLALQKAMFEGQQEAGKLGFRESAKTTENIMRMVTQGKAQERLDARELMALQYRMGGEQSRTAMMMALIQALAQAGQNRPQLPMPSSPVTMSALLRGGY